MAKDNGGAIAQKGFNYQNYVISLVAIRNYTKDNFSIYVEADDDFEVMYDDNYHAYIQVKGQKLSINKLLQKANNKPSIFEKHLSSGDNNSVFKIVVFNFTESDLKMMKIQIDNEELFSKSWGLSDEQKSTVNSILDGVEFKLNNFSLVKTEFDNNSDCARKFLTGELVDHKISVDGRNDIILNELMNIIQQKSEIIISSDDDKELKRIQASELNLILKKVTSKARFDDELKKLNFTTIKMEKIKKEEFKIIITYNSIKKKIIDVLNCDKTRLETNHLVTLIPDIINLDIMNGLDENTKYAIIISAYCDILEGIANE
jgi:hypothetical protein